jgi:hypothetical protein
MMHTIKAPAKGEPPTGWWLSFFAVFCLIQAQPGLLGQNWGVVTLLANLLCAGILLLRGEGRLDPVLLLFLLMFPAYAAVVAFQYGLLDPMKGILLATAHSILLCLVLCGPRPDRLGRAYVSLMAVVCVLFFLTLFIRFADVFAINPDVRFGIKHYDDADALFFYPFAFVYPQYYWFPGISVPLPRAMGVFREPGVFQAFAATAALLAPRYFVGRKLYLIVALLLAGVLAANSTAGLASFIMVLALLPFLCPMRRWVKILLLLLCLGLASVVAVVWVFDESSLGLAGKLSGESGEDRALAVQELQAHWLKAPVWGLIQSGNRDLVQSHTGSLPLFFLRYGVVGLLLSALPVLWLLRRGHWGRLLPLAPLAMTALASQPLWATGPFLAVVFLAFPAREDVASDSRVG